MKTDLPFPESLPGFQKLFPDDAACAAYLELIHWPVGFKCPCGWAGEPYRFAHRPGVLRCRNCQRDARLTAGTVMENTRTPLSTWFWAAYLLASQTPGMSAVQFQRQLGLSRYETAFQILHKLRAGMVRPNVDRIGGNGVEIEMDETLVGGATRGEGKGVHHKTYVIGCVEVRRHPPVGKWEPWKPSMSSAGICLCGAEAEFKSGDQLRCARCVPTPTKSKMRRAGTYAGRLRLRVVPDRKADTLLAFARESIAIGSHVTTDDWSGYDRLSSEVGVDHEQIPERGDPEVAERFLPLIHLEFSNLKAWLIGTHHGVSSTHLQAYLNEFTFRFNRRFYPFNAFRSLLGIASDAEPPTYESLYSGEYHHPWALTG